MTPTRRIFASLLRFLPGTGFRLLLVAAVVLIVAYRVLTRPERIRRLAIDEISKLTQMDTRVARADFSLLDGIRLWDIELRNSAADASPLLRVQAIHLSLDSSAIWRGEIIPRKIIIARPECRVPRIEALALQLAHLKGPGSGGSVPEVIVRSGRISMGSAANTLGPSLVVDAQVSPARPGVQLLRMVVDAEGTVGGQHAAESLVVQGEMESARPLIRLRSTPIQVTGPLSLWLPHGWQDILAKFGVTGALQVGDVSLRGSTWDLSAIATNLQAGVDIASLAEHRPHVPAAGIRVGPSDIVLKAGSSTGASATGAMAIEGMNVTFTAKAPDLAKAEVQVTAKLETTTIRAGLPWIAKLPREARQAVERFTQGGPLTADFSLAIDAKTPEPRWNLTIALADATVTYSLLPYAVSHLKGTTTFACDGKSSDVSLNFQGSGLGLPGTVNEKAVISVRGEVTPLTAENLVDIRIEGRGLSVDRDMKAALDTRIREPLARLDPDPGERDIEAAGDFDCHVRRDFGLKKPYATKVHIAFRDARLRIPRTGYIVEDVIGEADISSGDVKVNLDAALVEYGSKSPANDEVPPARAHVKGTIGISDKVIRPSIEDISIRNLAITPAFLPLIEQFTPSPLPIDHVSGRITLTGRITPSENAPAPAGNASFRIAARPDVKIKIANLALVTLPGTGMLPGNLALRDGQASMDLTQREVSFEVTGFAGPATRPADLSRRTGEPADNLSIVGQANTDTNEWSVRIAGDAWRLSSEFSQWLPQEKRALWDDLEPSGLASFTLGMTGSIRREAGKDRVSRLELQLLPKDMSLQLPWINMPAEHIRGQVTLTRTGIRFDRIEGQIADGEFWGSGNIPAGSSTFDLGVLRVEGVDLEQVLDSVREQRGGRMPAVKATGRISLGLSKIEIPLQKGRDFELRGQVLLEGVQGEAPLQIAKTDMTLEITQASLRAGKLEAIEGRVNLTKATIEGVELSQLAARVGLDLARRKLDIPSLRANMADGTLSGHGQVTFAPGPEQGFTATATVDNASLPLLLPEANLDQTSRLNLSLSLEGGLGDRSSVRGRGDVLVTGNRLYRVPIVFSLMEVANLSLPLNSPFSRAATSYAIDGARVILENIELESETMRMSGYGQFDLSTNEVSLLFSTENPSWFRIPVIEDLVSITRRSLSIEVSGKLGTPRPRAGGAIKVIDTTVEKVRDAGKRGKPTTAPATRPK